MLATPPQAATKIMAGMAGMAERQKEWQNWWNGRKGYYVLSPYRVRDNILSHNASSYAYVLLFM